jgi:hypothetical protein
MKRTRRLGTALALALAAGSAILAPTASAATAPTVGMLCLPGSLSGTTRTFNLTADDGHILTPDGNAVYMWSYTNADASPYTNVPGNGHFQSPGPVLCANQNETIVVNFTNTLPEASSIVFPGQDGAVTATGGSAGLMTQEAAANGGTVSYTFTAANPGTYLYESGSDISKQIEMGLYGALVVRPAGHANYAYDARTQFDPNREYILLLGEIDPFLHQAVETNSSYDFNTLKDRYYTINGRAFPDTIQDNGSQLLPNQPYGALVRLQPNTGPANADGTCAGTTCPTLIRMLNPGHANHPFHPHGNHTREIAQDGRLLRSPAGGDASTEHFGETIGAGETEDFLVRWDNTGADSSHQPFNDNWTPTSNQFSIPAPNYLNVRFKDDHTWYAGSPYLGYKGTLPTGTVSQNVCGEWYFPFHSHALDEFSNFNEGFGGMGTLLRVDPQGGCFTSGVGTTIVSGVAKSGTGTALSADDATYYQVNPKTTTRTTATANAAGTTVNFTVASAAGFQATNGFYIRVDNEVMQVTAGAGTTNWTVLRGALGSTTSSHLSGATVTSLANDWYATFTGVLSGSSNLKVTYKGKNCGNTTGTTCTALTTNVPLQTVKICDWTLAGGCATATSGGWVPLPAPQSQPVGSTPEVSTTWTLPGPAGHYIGTGANNGQVRILVHTQRWTATSPTPFSTWGNFMQLVYDAP